jgi:hypothetical protein
MSDLHILLPICCATEVGKNMMEKLSLIGCTKKIMKYHVRGINLKI